VRGTLKKIEVERWGGEQAHRWVGSLKLLQDLHASEKELSRPASALAIYPLRLQGEASPGELSESGFGRPFHPHAEGRRRGGLRFRPIRFRLTAQLFCVHLNVHGFSGRDVDAHRVHSRILAYIHHNLLEQARGFEHIGAGRRILEHEAQSLSRSVLV
jgi:hypothetical protein